MKFIANLFKQCFNFIFNVKSSPKKNFHYKIEVSDKEINDVWKYVKETTIIN